jgi:hypothetical protein
MKITSLFFLIIISDSNIEVLIDPQLISYGTCILKDSLLSLHNIWDYLPNNLGNNSCINIPKFQSIDVPNNNLFNNSESSEIYKDLLGDPKRNIRLKTIKLSNLECLFFSLGLISKEIIDIINNCNELITNNNITYTDYY